MMSARPFAAAIAVAPLFAWAGASGQPTAPAQPASGPGGADYSYERVGHETYGQGSEQYWIFEPQNASRRRTTTDLPAVVFVHGWGAMNPAYYGAWIEHLVRRGHTVIYPRYQDSLHTPPAEMTAHALAAVRDAFMRLGAPRPWVVIGHSMGGVIGANLSARAAQSEIGAPLAVLSVEPGKTWGNSQRATIPLDDLRMLPRDLLLVTVAGDRDTVVLDKDARLIFERASGVPATRKRYVVVRSDDHGTPAVAATHTAPTGPDEEFDLLPQPERSRLAPRLIEHCRTRARAAERAVSAIDYYAFWKLADSVIAFAASGIASPFSPENERSLAYMGLWSDGRPVKELELYAQLPPAAGGQSRPIEPGTSR